MQSTDSYLHSSNTEDIDCISNKIPLAFNVKFSQAVSTMSLELGTNDTVYSSFVYSSFVYSSVGAFIGSVLPYNSLLLTIYIDR